MRETPPAHRVPPLVLRARLRPSLQQRPHQPGPVEERREVERREAPLAAGVERGPRGYEGPDGRLVVAEDGHVEVRVGYLAAGFWAWDGEKSEERRWG